MDTGLVASETDTKLRAHGSSERAERERAYLRSELQHYGTAVPVVRSVARSVAVRYPDLTHDDLILLVDHLWSVLAHERRMAAVELLKIYLDRLQRDDIFVLEQLLRESRTWALVDTLAIFVVAPLVEQYPDLVTTFDRWATDDDFWMRRSALLALLPALRRGAGDFARFSGYADSMLQEKEFFVRKAIGWVLRETARKRPVMVYEWLMPRAQSASGVTVREAVKPLSADQRSSILSARHRPV